MATRGARQNWGPAYPGDIEPLGKAQKKFFFSGPTTKKGGPLRKNNLNFFYIFLFICSQSIIKHILL